MSDIYHILNRGVEKRKIFHDNQDYVRFVHDIYDFNNIENVEQSYFRRRQDTQLTDVGRPSNMLADVLCWTLMPNHSHIMIVEIEESGVSNFSKKIFGGYTKYFNERNKRSGVLFQGKSKKIIIQEEAHFLYLPFYIHLNPLDLFQVKWKEDGIKNVKGAMKFLENYRWSNYRDIVGKGIGEFSDVTSKELFFEMYQTNEKKYKKDLEEWITDGGYRKNNFDGFEH